MRKITTVFIFILLASVLVCFAQDRKTDPESVETFEPKQVDNSKTNDQVLLKSGTSLDAQLMSTLDVKKSEVGDQIVFKTTEKIKENGRVIIPKGTRLIGRITEVQQKTEENAMSRISIVFESIEGKNLSAPLNASVVSITNTRSKVTAGDLFGSDTHTSSSASGNGSSSGGGLLSGGGGLVGGATQTVGGVLNTTTQTAASGVGAVGQTGGSVGGTVGQTVGGIDLKQSASGSANSSTTLSRQDKNLRIEKGARFQVQLNNSIQN